MREPGDVGSEQMHVSIAGSPPEVFGTFTTELHRLREWLKERGVKSVALEATGVGCRRKAFWSAAASAARRRFPWRKTASCRTKAPSTLRSAGALHFRFMASIRVQILEVEACYEMKAI